MEETETTTGRRAVEGCLLLFAICFLFHLQDALTPQTVRAVIGENFITKAFVLFLVLHRLKWKWGDIGFDRRDMWRRMAEGLLLGAVSFAVSFSAELLLLVLQGQRPQLEYYIADFTMTGTEVRNTGLFFITLCFGFHSINVFMDEGLFRGYFLKRLEGACGEKTGLLLTGLLFGIWHTVTPLAGYLAGSMSLLMLLVTMIGSVALAAVMSIKWSLLKEMTGSVWMGLADHLFHNFVAVSLVHVVTESGTDEWMLLRVALAQLFSFGAVIVWYRRMGKTAGTDDFTRAV